MIRQAACRHVGRNLPDNEFLTSLKEKSLFEQKPRVFRVCLAKALLSLGRLARPIRESAVVESD
jgi:hypothetical protein